MAEKNPLAYARVIDKIKLPEQYNRGKKIMEEDKKEIRKLYKTGKYSYRALAQMWGVSATTIQITIDDKRRLANLKLAAEYHKKHQAEMNLRNRGNAMELRYYKKRLIEEGKIIIKTTK
jgi:DNA-binding XRE family transcriptional regulator